MSEQPQGSTALIAPEDAPYGWEHVAHEMQDWHPDLQEHARRNLAARGIALTEQAGATQEKSRATAEEVSAAFADGQRTLYKLSADPHFHGTCIEQGVDPYDDMDKPSYWNTVANYTHDRIAKMRDKNGDSLPLRTLELLSATPAYLFEQQALNRDTHANSAERLHGKEVVSYFNCLIRDFATEFPATRASAMHTGLLNVANMALEDKAMRQTAAQDIRQTIRGAQHESAFGQILQRTGHAFRPAEVQEDLKGIDYVVDEGTVGQMYIDVKASLSEVEARGSDGAFVRKPDGKVVMYSLVTDSELGDTFYLQAAAVAMKAPALDQLLAQAGGRAA